jgi:hypothetical protein
MRRLAGMPEEAARAGMLAGVGNRVGLPGAGFSVRRRIIHSDTNNINGDSRGYFGIDPADSDDHVDRQLAAIRCYDLPRNRLFPGDLG